MPDSIYPTKEEILAGLEEPKLKHRELLLAWKNGWYDGLWKNILRKNERLDALTALVGVFRPDIQVVYGEAYLWVPSANTIALDLRHPSILSTLHELGHALYGPSELTACTFSISLFKTCFPKAYAKLTWERHMLVQKP